MTTYCFNSSAHLWHISVKKYALHSLYTVHVLMFETLSEAPGDYYYTPSIQFLNEAPW